MSKFKEFLPAESRSEFRALIDEGRAITKASHKAALDSANTAAHAMATAIIMRRSLCLQSSGLLHEVQQMVQALPFEGQSLFLDQTDAQLHSLKDSCATLISLGLHTLEPSRKHFKPQRRPVLPATIPTQAQFWQAAEQGV